MRYLSFVKEHCKQTAKKYSLWNEIVNLSTKVEKDQSVQAWDFFLPTPFIKKDLGRHYRLICSQHSIEDKGLIVIAFLACFPRGGSGEYEKFIKNPDQVCGKFLPGEEDLEAFIKSRRQSLPEPHPEPNETERQYLYATLEQDRNSDTMVYESLDWVESMKNQKVLEESTRLYDLLYNLLDSSEKGNSDIHDNEKSKISILYKFLPQHNSIFLISPLLKKDSVSINSLKSKYNDIIEQDVCSEESILKHCRRSYPSYILADEQMWKSIQKNDVGNIALSPEESKILEAVISRTGDRLFPLFINGRPGSGKSTILQYLFASYLCMYARQEEESRFQYPPLYLTYSERLLDSARKNIDDILRCNSEIAISGIDLNSDIALQIHDKCYGVFHEFLLNLLPSETKKNFPLVKNIDFPKFRNRWDNQRKGNPQSEVRKLSSEVAWHILRSYIKGMRYDAESDFSVEAYLELPNNQRTVQVETFERVYEHVWERWYKPYCEKDGFWDDQDLVFAVLNEPELDLSRYPAVFCDEAQDFSKLELDLILRLSLYSQRTISPHELKRVPFAFAGDPFQTLNPTGFEWESLQANFHEKIVSGLDKLSIGKLEFNYQELSYNYRSSKFIVGLCNLFQLLRGILFDQKGLMPQRTWFDSEGSMPVLFNVKEPVCEKKLRDQAELVIILPCQEGEEEDYVKQDEFLRSLATSELDIRNFLSPMRAKGLEFSRVVLYKFGNACIRQYPNLFEPLSTTISHSDNMDTSLPLKYFLNRLYVGASRAKVRLIIVDDDEGITALWDHNAIKSFENLLKLYPNGTKLGWSPSVINYVQKGVEDNWTQDRDDPLSLAEEFHESGLTEKDPYKLRLAEANYTRCKQPANAKLCKAERYEMEKQFSKAGELYLEIRRTEKALECYWVAGDFSTIDININFANTAEQRAASFHLGNHSEAESEHFLHFLLEQLSVTDSYKITWDPQWKKILDECLDSILELSKGADFTKLYTLIREIDRKHLSPSDQWRYAELAYLAKEYEHAVSLWESSSAKPDNKQNYCVAKANVSPYPFNLKWMEKIENYKQIIYDWKDNQKVGLDEKNVAIVSKSFIKLRNFDYTLIFFENYPNEECLRETYKEIKKNSLKSHQETIGQLLISEYAKNGKWKEIVDLVNDKKLSKASMDIFTGVLACEIAQSKKFRQTTIENKNAVAGLLKKLFVDTPWKNIVPMRVAGAAIESAYKIIDALEFYEGVWKNKRIPGKKEDIDYATARWVKSKLRLAEFLENEGKRKGAGKHRAEAENICRTRLDINKEKIPDDPDFDIDANLMKEVISKANISTIPQKTQEGIIALHQTGWKPKEISESFNIEVKLVEKIIQQ
ncbi:MAG: hypothetical protein JW836_14565 [Deltaproteobacteria bacterium]|nr:hypothetical protein [Deltaproteobacteria bacterium]